MGLPRYDIQYYSVEDGQEEQSFLWQTQQQVTARLRQMKNGDDMVVHRTDNDAEEGHLYL